MRIFLSHSSYHKPLVREVRGHLPHFLTSWLDEENLLFGDEIPASIEATIKSDSDFVLLFIDDHAARSQWVRREVQWALEAERLHNRTIVLPIVIEESALETLGVVELSDRKYIRLQNFQESSVRTLARSVSDALFALICRDMERLHHPELRTVLAKVAESDALLRAQAAIVHKIVFPHRSTNPIPKEKLLDVLNAHNDTLIANNDIDPILTSILQRNLIPGLSYDGFVAFLVEEHAQWKGEMHRDKKERIARKAVNLIQNGMKVVLDAGSTIEEVVRLLCKRIETRAITKLTVTTTSVNIADMISDCCVKMGFDDDFSAVSLLIPGGQIRPNTQAIVPCGGKDPHDLVTLALSLGGFDLGIIGVNGIDAEKGFTTHHNAEKWNKEDILAIARRRVVLGDSAKVGLVLEHKFADFGDDLTLVVDDDDTNESLKSMVRQFAQKVILA